MAALSREPTAPSSQPISAPHIVASPTVASPRSRDPSEQPQLSSLANEGLKATAADPSNKLKRPLPFEPPPLTGAAALADQQRQQQDDAKRQRPQLTSTNPASSVKNTLLGQSSPTMNKTSDNPASAASAARPTTPTKTTPMITLANTATVAEPMQVEQTSPVSMTEDESAALRNSQTSGSNGNHTRLLTTSTPEHSHPNKALTYPPPQSPAEEVPGRSRTLSYPNPSSAPNSSSKGSGKKHKCPNCDTEFTRHHNLKSHLLTHSQEKPYVCTSCNAKFRRLHDLKRHNKLHTGERNHICNICGRKFARGDALARHAKGPAGCAGRRGSGMGDDDDTGSNIDDSMEGVVYNGDGDDSMAEAHRRRSEPHRKSTAPIRSDTGSSPYRNSTSTYPPVANMVNPPRSSIGHAGPSHHNQLNVNGPHFSQVQYSSSPGSYVQQPGVVESPKPLSPSQPEPHRLSASEASRNRSPSLAQQFQQTHFGRGSGRGTPPLNLPAPAHGSSGQGQQLPSLPSLTGDPRNNAFHPQGGRLGSNSSAVLPSQNGSTGSSVRDLMPGSGRDSEGEIMNYMREMEGRMQERMQQELSHQKAEYERRISQMQDEINSLRSSQVESNGKGPANKG